MKLLPRKEFEITLKNETYRGKFSTYAYKLFCNKKGIKLQEVDNVFPEDAQTIDIMDSVIDLIICAIESVAERERRKVRLERVDFWDAMDDKELTADDIIKIFNHAADEEVKNVNGENLPAGMISNEVSTQLGENRTSSGL
jgi:hypothetical protein